MDCLTPPLLEVPSGNWYCDSCFDSSTDESDVDSDEISALNDVELVESRLRSRGPQPQITRTMQSERIRNAILARMSLRSARESFGEGPSTSNARSTARPRKTTTRRRKARRRTKTVVVEYGLDGSDKFAMKTRRVKSRRGRKKRRKVKRAPRRTAVASSQNENMNRKFPSKLDRIFGRTTALPNFSLFESANQLDYVPDEEEVIDSGTATGGLLTQGLISLNNPLRRSINIKNRVIQNCTTTSNAGNLLDSIMEDQDMFASGSIRNRFAVDSSSGRLLFVGSKLENAKQTSGGEEGGSKSSGEPSHNEPAEPPTNTTTRDQEPPAAQPSYPPEANRNFNDGSGSSIILEPSSINQQETALDKKKKLKKPSLDMFDENSNQESNEDCPNFSIYDSIDAADDQDSSSRFQTKPNAYDEENVDLVQMSDNEQHNESSSEAPPAIVASQPASPDLENDKVGESMPERSYTPPLVQKTSDDAPDKDDHDRKKRDRESKRSRKRELERYNVRDRLKERSPVKIKDKFGRNRSRSRSSPRRKQPRRRSRSISKDRCRNSRSRERYRKSRSPKSYSRSRSRRRTPNIEFDRKKKTHKEKAAKRRSRSRSHASRHQRPTTPDRRVRSRSKKAKRKKQRDDSKEKPSTLRKEVFTSGQNILVSLNFNNQEGKSTPKRLKSRDREEPKEIVDITTRKKITISSKPVAIIDLARSPFRELTPEYKSNVIELSDSDGEKAGDKKAPKSPDSTLSSKLYDPFDILNSPPNENVTSSQNIAAQMIQQQKPQEKIPEPVKNNLTYNKNVMALAANSGLFLNEENLVSSSSSLLTNEKHSLIAKLDSNEKNITKHDAVPMDIAESPYSPGHFDDSFENNDNEGGDKSSKQSKGKGIFDELFGSSTPPGLDRLKSSKKSGKLNTQSF